MKSNRSNKIEYTGDLEKFFIEGLLGNPETYVRCKTILRSEYWRPPYQKAAEFIINYTEKNNTLPAVAEIKAHTGLQLDSVSLNPQQNNDLLEQVEHFCRHKAMEKLIYDGPDMILSGSYAEIEQRAKENMLISLQKNLGTDYFDNPAERLRRMIERKQTVSTGWEDIDYHLYGGLNRGELTFFVGGPGTGKSLFLQNIARNFTLMGLNVVYITLELSEDLVSLRFDAMNTEYPTKQVFKNINDVELRLNMLHKKIKANSGSGSLQIVKMPEAGTNCKSIEAYLKEYEIQKGFRPDALIVDYLDLLHPNNNKIDPSNTFLKDKFTSEELRALAQQYNMLCVTASQLNRNSIQEQDYDASHIAGGISKINTADNVIALFTSINLRERGQYQIKFLKTRSSSGVGQKVWLKYDVNTLRITNMPQDEVPMEDNTIEDIKVSLTNKSIVVEKNMSSITASSQIKPPPTNGKNSAVLSAVANMRQGLLPKND